jgi:hypothetical protein
MTFHISQSLLIERTILMSGTIALFGLISTGGLLLLRRITARASTAGMKDARPKGAHR